MPKYKLNEELIIRTLKQNIRVKITERIKSTNIDTDEVNYYYSFEDVRDIKDAWTWDRVPEQNVSEMQFYAKQYEVSIV